MKNTSCCTSARHFGRFTISLLVAALSVVVCHADTVDAAHRVAWLSTVTDGRYDDPDNWTDGILPSSSIERSYGYVNFQSKDITLRVSPEGFVDSSGSIFVGAGSAEHTLTIDTRGTFWEKRGVKVTTDWWGVPFSINLTGTHVFNFESMDKVANNNLTWRFDDALFTWKSSTSRQDFDLWSGKFSFAKSFYLGASGGSVNFYIHPGATLYSTDTTGTYYQRGNATTHTWFLGGNHSLWVLYLKETNADVGSTWMHVTNDAHVVVRSEMHVGARSYGNVHTGGGQGFLDVSSDAKMSVTGGVYLGSAATTYPDLHNRGVLTLRDQAAFYAGNAMIIGRSQCSTGIVTVSDNASVTLVGSCQIATTSNAWGRLELTGASAMSIGGILGIAYGGAGGSYGEVVLDDDAAVTMGVNWLCLGSHTHAGSVARFTAKGRSSLISSGNTSVEMGYGFDADLELNVTDDAVVSLPNGTITNKVPVGGRSVLSISSNGVLAVRGVYGGVLGTDDDCMVFNADGGTLKVSGTSMPSVPFICGCASATIGEHGLSFDSSGFDVAFDQAFTAADGASEATLTKTGIGTLTVLRNSSHPKTVVSQGALRFGAGVTRFGNALELAAGAKLALADATASVTAESLVFSGMLELMVPGDYVLDQVYPILSVSGGVTQEQLSGIIVSNPEVGKAYALSLDGDGKTVKLTVSAAAGGAKTWAGGVAGNWNTDGNWSPAGVPTHNDDVTVESAAAITLSGPAAAAKISATAAKTVLVSGASPLYIASEVEVAEGGTLSLMTPVRNATGTVAKNGKGTLTMGGNSEETFAGDWRLERGVTEYKSAAAIGADTTSASALSISNCTFKYSGSAAEIERPWRLIGELPSIFDIAGDLTFKNFKISHSQADGGFAKLGAGALTLEMPSGTTTLSWYKNASRGSNSDISGVFSTDCGETTSWNGLAQLTLLEGRLAIIGKGKGVTTVDQQHHAGIGGCGYVAAAAPELYLKDLTMSMGSGSGFHTLMGQSMAAGSAAPKLILDNANLTCNGLYVGNSKASGNTDIVRPVLAITNSTLNVTWNCEISRTAGMEPIVRVGAGGVLARNSTTASGGLYFNNALDARVEDGGQIYVTSPQNLYFNGSAAGDLVFARGGGMKVNRFLGLNSSTKAEIVLDEGYAQFTLNGGISTMTNPSKCGIRVDAGGGELIAASGVTHILAIPVRGQGKIVKRGAGTIVFTNDLRVAMSNNQPSYTPLASSTVMVSNTGGLEVAEGTVKCVAGTTDANSRFSGVGTLSGDFTEFFLDVVPGAVDALTFSDLTATKVTVDFGRMPGATFNWRDAPTAVVAKIATAEAFRAIQWRSVNRGDGMTVDIRYDSANGLAVAYFRPSGCMIIFK
jgi:hypothetical protein